MARPYHSPSSIQTGIDCEFALAQTYLEDQRDPNVMWDERFLEFKWDFGANKFVHPSMGEVLSAKTRGSALGLGLHQTAERWYDPSRGTPNWQWHPGLVFASGKHLLPEPSKIDRVVIEEPIGTIPLPSREHVREGQPTVAIEVEGILWSGFIDNEAHGGDELKRLGINAPDGVAVLDYKSTSSIEKYALTPAELLQNPQGALYAVAECRKLGLHAVPERWVYFESKKVRRALPIDVTAELTRAVDVIGPCADLARKLDMITRAEEARKNPASCNKYGPPDRINCQHHKVNGGRCNAWAPFRSLAQITPKKPEIVAMATPTEAERKAAFEKKKADMAAARAAKEAGATAGAAETGTDADDPVEDTTSGLTDEEAKGNPAPFKPVATTPVRTALPKQVKPAEGSQAATIAALATELATADKARDAVLVKLRAAVA